jgi:hypothetical protein
MLPAVATAPRAVELTPAQRRTVARTVENLTRAQRKTLTGIIDHGGEVNSYTRQTGIDVRSIPILVKRNLLDLIGTCDCWETAGVSPCNIEHGQVDTPHCYRRVVVNARGRLAHALCIGNG